MARTPDGLCDVVDHGAHAGAGSVPWARERCRDCGAAIGDEEDDRSDLALAQGWLTGSDARGDPGGRATTARPPDSSFENPTGSP